MKRLYGFFHHLAFPHAGNNYKAKALHLDALTVYLLVAIVLTVVAKYVYLNPGDILGFATDIHTQTLYELTNQERKNNQLNELSHSDKLATAAHNKAQDMFLHNYWAHFGPNGTTPWMFIQNAGYEYEYAGENLAKNFLTSKGVVDAWMNSPSHKENLLRPEYTDIGFAIVNGVLNGEETTLVVQMFGTPLKTPATQTTNSEQTSIETTQNNLPAAKTVKEQAPLILSEESNNPKINLFPIYVKINIIFVIFLSLVLLSDFYIAHKLGLSRRNSKHLAHFIFINFILFGLLFISKGVIY